MILELDTSLLKLLNITINQLVFITLVLNENQKNNQNIHELLSRVSDEDIQELIQRNIIVVKITDDNKIYKISENILSTIKKDVDTLFNEFYEVFPVYVSRPDGTKSFLRTNKNKCRKEYNKLTRRSLAMHESIMEALKWEIENKTMTGKLGYLKTMWKWLTQREWESYEEQMRLEQPTQQTNYGNDFL